MSDTAIRDVNIVGAEVNAGQQIVRKWMAHLLDANFGIGTPSWYRIGRDLQEYNVDLNPDTEVRKNIWGNTSFVHNGYEPSGENDTFYSRKGDPLFEKLQDIVDNLKTGDACKTSALEVHAWDETGSNTNVFVATKQDCYVVPTSYGGDTSGYQIPFQVNYVGDKVKGTYNALTKTFTPTNETANAKLSALTIGSLTLSPTFDADTTSYTTSTTDATNTVTATAADNGASIVVTNNGNSVTNGSSVTWSEGENALTITVTKGAASKTYAVTVTKS